MTNQRLLVLISGNGSNLQSLIDKITINKSLPASIVGVISNKKQAYGIERAKQYNIPTSILTLKSYKDQNKTRLDYDIDLAKLVMSYNPDIIVLAGFMHILSKEFLNNILSNVEIINLHPALPNAFDGANAIERAFNAFQNNEIQFTGVMVHKVIQEVDKGEPIVMEKVEIKKEDELKDLENRIHNIEHRLIFEAVKILVEKRIKN